MIDFLPPIRNIKIKHLHGTYIYEKQQIKQLKHLHGTYIYEKQQIKQLLLKRFLIEKWN